MHSPARLPVFTAPVAGLLAALIAAPLASADVKLPSVFGDHMVLQRDVAAPVWGWADPGEEVTVSIGGQDRSAKAGSDGKWMVKLPPLKGGKPETLTVKGKNTVKFDDVLVGEVWLCSGQSNMAMTVNRANNFEQEKAAASLPQVRMFTAARTPRTTPQADVQGKWEVCTADTVGAFSATAYFFGRDIHKALGVPVGLINSSYGGTPIEAWTSAEAQQNWPGAKEQFAQWEKQAATWDAAAAEEKFQKQLAAWKEASAKAKAEGKPVPRTPSKPVHPDQSQGRPANLFNGMIHPLIPYAIRGALWYQGESNAGRGELYGLMLQTLIQDWRARWGGGDFPFAWVQLPNFHKPQSAPVEETGWVKVREGMFKTLKLPNTGMAITVDVGEAEDIHPKDKQTVGKRLAMWALAKVYGKSNVVASGPLYKSHSVKGSTVTVRFDYADGLKAKDGGELKGFAIAAADRQWKPAQARIKGDTIEVSSPDVKEPAAARYNWADNPDGNLYNGGGIPAAPFRTDDWSETPPK